MAKAGTISSDLARHNIELFERVMKEVADRRASSGIFLPESIPNIINDCIVATARNNNIDAEVVRKECTSTLHLSDNELFEVLSDYIYDMSPTYEKKLMKRCKKDDPVAIQNRLHEIKGSKFTKFEY